jgi:cytochrome c oxidase assembly protein subunit 15
MQLQTNEPLNHHRALHGFALFTALCTLILIIAGALVTGNDAGLAVPDWPLSYGSLTPPMIGGIFYEHGHRMVASFVGFLTVILAFWLWRKERRKSVQRLGWIALATVVTQGILGGITVLFFLPAPVSVMHACLAQAFFCIVSTLAVVTSRGWKEVHVPVGRDLAGISMRRLCVVTTASVYLQLILGAALRHSRSGLILHVVGAFFVTFCMVWTIARIYKHYSAIPRLFRPALILGMLLAAQLTLGVGSYLVRLASLDEVQPGIVMVTVTTAHVATGALVLVVSLLLTIWCFRLLSPAAQKMPLKAVLQEVKS